MKQLGADKILLFTENMAALIKSGLSLQDSIQVCRDISADKQISALCDFLFFQLGNGLCLSKALRNYGKSFSSLYISLVEIGENIGSLQEVFEKLSVYLREKKETSSKIMQALLYPLIVFFTAIVVVSIIMFFVFPRLEEVFEVFTESSAQISQKINNIKSLITVSSVVFGLIVLLVVALFILHRRSKKVAYYLDYLVFKVPFVSRYFQTIYSSDFSFAMKLLCSSGVTFADSLKQTESIVSNLYYQKELKKVQDQIQQGSDISKVFSNKDVFPNYLSTWIKLSSKAGNVENVFSQIYEYYKTETSNIISNLVVSAEPVFILITGIVIFVLVAQFVIPVFSLLGAL